MFFSTSPVATVVLVTVMGVTAFAASPVLGALVRRFAGSAPTLASALASSSSNVGVAVGSWAAGIALASPLGQAGPPLVGTVTAALTLVPLTALVLMRATRSDDHAVTSDPSPRGRARVG
ncbi:hypothetical protein [Streptomyces sp. AC555_RSS877]|uniref:hypothetical protein n=1 Tax=Streptomyces sp. AC555_RSS877 TaxID=2823688 RepID=UPI0020B7FADB|nr:hypothetical protein [Streptomyces sp. AC555_RSS877]